MAKIRADILIYEKGLSSSREKAKRIIMEGRAFVGTMRIEKPGEQIDEDKKITIKEKEVDYVSRGALKLKKALNEFSLDLENCICIDIGASTGGFTDVMLKSGAKKVYAIDVGYNQLDYKLRVDDRVVVMERTNIRYLDFKLIKDEIDFISIDVSFISLKLVLPVAEKLLKKNGNIVALIKPQFEAGRELVGKNGIVRDNSTHKMVIEEIVNFSNSIGLYTSSITFSPIKGTKGNIEFLIHLTKDKDIEIQKNLIDEVIHETKILG